MIQLCKGIVYHLNSIGQKIYHIAPGGQGEIMIDCRRQESPLRSFEIIIYPDKIKYVKFPENGTPYQSEFVPDLLHSELIAWLNK